MSEERRRLKTIKKDTGRFKVFIETCKTFKDMGDTRYGKLQEKK